MSVKKDWNGWLCRTGGRVLVLPDYLVRIIFERMGELEDIEDAEFGGMVQCEDSLGGLWLRGIVHTEVERYNDGRAFVFYEFEPSSSGCIVKVEE